MQLATSVALLIELKAQFYKLVTINQCLTAYTCEMVNKSSKSDLCYIDSDPIVIDTRSHFGNPVYISFCSCVTVCRNRCVREIDDNKWCAACAVHHFFCMQAQEVKQKRRDGNGERKV